MRSLLLKSAGFIALASAVAFACGDANRTFVNTEASGGMGGTDATGGIGGTGGTKGGKGGGAGTSGSAGEAGSGADGGTAGSGAGRGGTGATSGTAGEAGDTGVGGSTGGSQGGRGGTGTGNGGGGEGGEVIIDLDPGKPGVSMLPAGAWMTSETYKLFGVMSEGQMPVNSSSTHYVLHGSVIGATQPGDATQ
jgi:hypothetical protein